MQSKMTYVKESVQFDVLIRVQIQSERKFCFLIEFFKIASSFANNFGVDSCREIHISFDRFSFFHVVFTAVVSNEIFMNG